MHLVRLVRHSALRGRLLLDLLDRAGKVRALEQKQELDSGSKQSSRVLAEVEVEAEAELEVCLGVRGDTSDRLGLQLERALERVFAPLCLRLPGSCFKPVVLLCYGMLLLSRDSDRCAVRVRHNIERNTVWISRKNFSIKVGSRT